MSENVIKTNVVIVGAGIAGLSSASLFVKNHFSDFVILEARDRIGGRILSFDGPNRKLELGANWIHGVLGNPIFELALSNGLIDVSHCPTPKKIVATLQTGQVVPFKVLQEIYQAYVCFIRRCEEYFLCQYSPPQNIHNVGEHVRLEIDLYLKKYTNKEDRKLRKQIFDCLLKRETCITGCDNMNEIDLLELGSFTELQGGNITIPSGYTSLVDAIVKTIPAEQLKLSCPVNKIKWCLNHDDSQDFNVQIECDNGTKLLAKHVIVTIPLGVLKKSCRSLFEPALPDYKLLAIDKLLFGTVDKIFLIYDRPFLNSEVSEILLIWDDVDDKRYGSRSSISSTESSEDESDLSEIWFKKIYSFSKLSDTILLGWISGRAAQYMETLSSDEVAEKCTEILRLFLNDECVPKPVRCVCSNWASQTFTRGSYTAMALGCSQFEIECIADPLYSNPNHVKPSVLFAGEHTHCNFYSTVHGAYLTGRAAAQIILQPDISEQVVVDCENDTDLSALIEHINLS